MVMDPGSQNPYEILCPNCSEPISTVSFHCPCGAYGMYICPQCEGYLIEKSGKRLKCPHNCGNFLFERGKKEEEDPLQAATVSKGCRACGQPIDAHPHSTCDRGWFRGKEGKWAFG